MKTIRINRAKWLRGNIDNKFISNDLWCPKREAGCCLGHAIHQTAKCAWKDLARKSAPRMYYDKPSFLTNFCHDGSTYFSHDGLDNNEFAYKAMRINDALNISDALREKRLIKLFAEYNIKLEFYN